MKQSSYVVAERLVEGMEGIAITKGPVRSPGHMAWSLRPPYLAHFVYANDRKQLIMT